MEQPHNVPPQDINAEAAVLSAMMIDALAVSKAIEKLQEQHFYRTSHKVIYRVMMELFNEGIEIDLITVIARLDQKNLLEKAGTKSYLNEISDVVFTGANILYHIDIVVDKSLMRNLIITSENILRDCYTSDKDVKEIVEDAESAIFKIAEEPNKKSFVDLNSLIAETLENIEEVAKTKSSVLGIGTGFKDLDRKTGGFRKGQFIVLAARPAMGKTSLALNIAFNNAMYHDKKIAIFTMEMGSDELLMRILSSASEVSMQNMLKGFGMTDQKISRIVQVADALSEKGIYIDDNGGNTMMDIRAKSRRLKAELGGLDMIIIDYLQLMNSGRRVESRQQEISEISRNLKILSKELELPIIALSQLNRGLESRDDKKPRLSDLRESGAIEQDADIVMFIYRDEYYNPESERKGISEVIIGKNRHGETGSVDLVFLKEFTSFRSIAHD